MNLFRFSHAFLILALSGIISGNAAATGPGIYAYDAKGETVGPYALHNSNYPSVLLKFRSGWVQTRVNIKYSNDYTTAEDTKKLYWIPDTNAFFYSTDCSGEPIPRLGNQSGMLPSVVIVTADGAKILYVGKNIGGSSRISQSSITYYTDEMQPICETREDTLLGWDVDFSVQLNSLFTEPLKIR